MENRTLKVPSAANDDGTPRKLGLFATIGSVLMAMLGVQSSKARERDFARGSPAAFIAIGVLLTIGFIVTLVLIVRLLLRNAGL